MEYFWAILAVSTFVMALGIWVLLAGDRSDAMTDEPSTLDTQNHIGDTRPVR